MSKPLKSHVVSLLEIKNQQRRKFDATCRIRICVCKETKNRKINSKKGGDKQKNQDSYSTMKNQTHFSLCECLIVIFKVLY